MPITLVTMHALTRTVPRRSSIIVAGIALLWCAFALNAAVGLGGPGVDAFFNNWVYNALMVAAGAACIARAVVYRAERLAWSIMGVGILFRVQVEVYYTLFLLDLDTVPIPSPADVGYLAFYPASYIALVLLVRSRMPNFPRSLWLDGAIGALATAALAAAVAFEPILESSVSGSTREIVVNLAYPIGDLVLLALVIAVFALSTWRPGRAWILLGAGLLLSAAADAAYLFQVANDAYVEGTLLDAAWPASVLLVGLAAWAPQTERRNFELEGLRVVVVPTACGLLALGLAVAADVSLLGHATTALSLATMLVVTLRMALAFRDNQKMLIDSRSEALTDALTGLGNRRRLMADLETMLTSARPDDPWIAVLFDLDGFKLYNDTFGHPAGDELLLRLGGRLQAAVKSFGGAAYRPGGDEFCVLVRLGGVAPEPVVAAASAALHERGEGFEVGASHGFVTLPLETGDVSEALQLADRRMYARKGKGRASAGRQTRDVLLSTLRERQPALYTHLTDVAQNAVAVARELSMTREEIDEVSRAAELHDIGKMAIPDAILDKPGSLDDEEWSFMRRHTVIGERILAAAPALAPVAKIVRSSHERWDGAGYPDGLAGEEIPLGARVVTVCDAFDAMTTDRAYRRALSTEEAMTELRACAGTQFDRVVVDAFVAVMERSATPV